MSLMPYADRHVDERTRMHLRLALSICHSLALATIDLVALAAERATDAVFRATR